MKKSLINLILTTSLVSIKSMIKISITEILYQMYQILTMNMIELIL